MSKVKDYLLGLVEKIHPGNYDKQDQLMQDVLAGLVTWEALEVLAENSQPKEEQPCGSE